MNDTTPVDSAKAFPAAAVTLVPVDEEVLRRLTVVATSDAAASDVTPPLTPGDKWTRQRVGWFENYHRSRRSGLTGAEGEATWAILHLGQPVGAVRLKRTDVDGVVETGIWLARTVRGRGIAGQAIRRVLQEARAAGAHSVRADTAPTNEAAQRLLRTLGFTLSPPAPDGRLHAVRRFD
ncbi:GNAT family N-acetyltransferase [Agromyces subbeticus]|uniref:GNAT family N-acetyltransferase n=1 Tax=Agromyces subbeticus TaxID=293890 RepID=UPI0009FED554|nr:GNAT family N-acetyltransferase [Agromyces subbeticus]